MNSIIEEQYELFQLYQALREQLMELLGNEDLAYTPGGANPSLGELCREMGQVQESYVKSFREFHHDWAYEEVDTALERSTARLKEWYTRLDRNLEAAVSALTEEEIQNRTIDRGGGFTVSPSVQLEIYKEALLIFYGKVSVYLKAKDKELPKQWRLWIT